MKHYLLTLLYKYLTQIPKHLDDLIIFWNNMNTIEFSVRVFIDDYDIETEWELNNAAITDWHS